MITFCKHPKLIIALTEIINTKPQPYDLNDKNQQLLYEKAKELAKEFLGVVYDPFT